MHKPQQGLQPPSITQDVVGNVVIPPRPEVLERLSAELNRRVPRVEAVVKLLSSDVGLAASLLKTANSPAFGLTRRLVSIHEAVTLLGFGTVEAAASEFLLRQSLGKGAPSMERFWDASRKIAQASRHVSRSVPGMRPDDAYVYGLFQDCGIALLIQRFADYKETLAAANAAVDRSFTDLEQQRYQTDHATVGYLLARTWRLPEHVSEAIRSHHEYELWAEEGSALPAASAQLIACALLAERCVQLATDLAKSVEWNKAGEAAVAYLDMKPAEFHEIAEDVRHLLRGEI
jgi:HD-like signal output (HDOD) protein